MIVAYAGVLELLRHARPAAFLAGVVLTLLAQSALSGLSSQVAARVTGIATLSTSTEPDGSPVRAARMVEARSHSAGGHADVWISEAEPTREPYCGHPRSSTDVARTTAIDETPASASPRTVMVPPRDDPALVVATLRAAAIEFGVDPDRLVAIARCESRLDPLAIGAAGELGILQFKPATFRANAALLGYRIDQVFDVRAQARTAAAKIAREGSWAWSCAK